MHHKLSITLRPLCLNIALWAGGVALLLISKDVIEWATGSTRDSSLELRLSQERGERLRDQNITARYSFNF